PPQDSTLLFFSNLTAPPQPYPLPLHDALPIFAIEDQRSRVPKRPRRLEHGTRSVAVEQPLRQPRSVHPALNGAVERGMDGSRLAQRLLDRDTARAVLESTRPFRHAAALVFDREDRKSVV